jgi:hypothetical protein
VGSLSWLNYPLYWDDLNLTTPTANRLDLLAAGLSADEILKDYPDLE